MVGQGRLFSGKWHDMALVQDIIKTWQDIVKIWQDICKIWQDIGKIWQDIGMIWKDISGNFRTLKCVN